VVLCEAPLDALTFWVNGIRNVTFFHGTGGFPDCLLDALLENRVRTIRLAYRADEAGNRAAARDAELLTARGIECFRVRFPWGMDANGYAQHQAAVALREGLATPAVKTLRVAVDAAEWMRGTLDVPAIRAAAPASFHESEAASEDPAASPAIPAPQRETPTLTRQGEYHVLTLGSREYRVGGLEKNNSLDVLKVSVRLRYGDDFHLDSIDMTRDGERRRFIERAADETGLEKDLLKRDLGKLLLAIEQAHHEWLESALGTTGDTVPAMSPEERDEALSLLKSPDLVERITGMFGDCGLAGEETNRLAAYLACTSRKLDRPLAVIIQSTSAAGKTMLMETVLSMFPEEDRVQYSAMTGQSLYYLGEQDLKHRILAIVEEEGAGKAGYALKLLQSEGELTIASTGKDLRTGRMETQEYRVEGPVMIFLTTTAIDIDEELQNRCLTLTVDESREQTERIHTLQRQARTLEGLRRKKRRQKLLRLLRNAQRLLEPVEVVNPWADQLTFTSERTRARRDHEKYLTLIDAIALLHQHQRTRGQIPEDGAKNQEQRTPNQEHPTYITVTLDDIALANRIAPGLLGLGLDELPPQSRQLLDHIKALVRDICRRDDVEQPLALFNRRQLCEASGWTYSQVKRHLTRLQGIEHIIPRYGGTGSTMRYELLADAGEPDRSAPRIGLLDVEKLRGYDGTTTTRTPAEASLPPPCQNRLESLSHLTSGRNANLATFPERASGTAAIGIVS
jgi:hypothetical protein